MKQALLYIWQLPQNLFGLLLIGWYKLLNQIFAQKKNLFYVERLAGAVTLGQYIILGSQYLLRDGTAEKHETGHTIQSKYLGPLYLIVIGLPSLLWAAFYQYNPNDPNGYYTKFYTERWADKLGGVVRE